MIVLVICVGSSKRPFVANVDNPSSLGDPIPSGWAVQEEDAFSPSPPSPLPPNSPVSSNPFEVNVSFAADSIEAPSSKVGFPNGSGSSVVIFDGGMFSVARWYPKLGT